MKRYAATIASALQRRSPLLRDPHSAVRVLHSTEVPGLVIERLTDTVLICERQRDCPLGADETRAVALGVREALGARTLFVDGELCAGMEEEHVCVREGTLAFALNPRAGPGACGLFLDARENRARVRAMAEGKRCLNLFAYTCGFSVAAVAGGASHVASVDSSARYLEWGKRNFAHNGLTMDPHRFYCNDVFEFYKRAKRNGWRYDLVIVDPPTFSRHKASQSVFVLADQMQSLCDGAVELLDEREGWMLLSTNDRGIGVDRLEAVAEQAGTRWRRRCTIVERPTLPIDFANDVDYAKSIIVRFHT